MGFKQDNVCPHTTAPSQHTLQNVDMLSWRARLPYLSPIEHEWVIIERLIKRYSQPELILPVLTDQVQQAGNFLEQTYMWHLQYKMLVRLHACVKSSGGYIGYYSTMFSHLKGLFWRLHINL
ncbi:uncharacterized protein TNCV_3256881 [Trichonephila clavipes]|nr:uncharacterized protein TNCV_3256881 [Trichonephila clavipes]